MCLLSEYTTSVLRSLANVQIAKWSHSPQKLAWVQMIAVYSLSSRLVDTGRISQLLRLNLFSRRKHNYTNEFCFANYVLLLPCIDCSVKLFAFESLVNTILWLTDDSVSKFQITLLIYLTTLCHLAGLCNVEW